MVYPLSRTTAWPPPLEPSNAMVVAPSPSLTEMASRKTHQRVTLSGDFVAGTTGSFWRWPLILPVSRPPRMIAPDGGYL